MSHVFQKFTGQRFCLGVTGLSRSGKTAFIASLIKQLLDHRKANLPGFSPILTGRLKGVKFHSLDEGLKSFPYEQACQDIMVNGCWPESTTDVSGCVLELKLSQERSILNPFSEDHYYRYIEIRDYPGEWLLDLPLLDMTYAEWSAQCSALYNSEPRKSLLGPLLQELQQLGPFATVDNNKLNAICNDFKKFLKRCKDQTNSLSLIQPGRFLIPGNIDDIDDIDDDELLAFVPLLKAAVYTQGQLDNSPRDSYYHVCKARYEKYVKKLVTPFYKDFCNNVDRQIVLVDVINALNGGSAYVDDMVKALANIIDMLSFGEQGAVMGLFRHKIDKVVFAATKIDQVVSGDHDNVRQLLALVLHQALQRARFENIEPVCEAIAAIRCSQEIEWDGDPGIAGTAINGSPIGYTYPNIPQKWPDGEQWKPFQDLKIPPLSPPQGRSARNHDPIPHIRMDTILQALIGDKLK